MPNPTHDITVQAPKELCRWCNAHIAQNQYTGQYFIQRKGKCDWCHDTADHNYHRNGFVTLATYIVGKVRVE